ncbi:MAG: YbaN family protein [Melioribacteraceae bacterium]|nr:YbaN family protein [Melioribacteraceae bacterium]
MKNIVFILLGGLFVIIGVIGIFVPLLPTTIFLIIASYFFMKSSPKLNEKLVNNKYLGPYIRNFQGNKGMPKRSKINAISLLWISILISAYFFTELFAIRILLLIIAISVTIYLLKLKTLDPQTVSENIN